MGKRGSLEWRCARRRHGWRTEDLADVRQSDVLGIIGHRISTGRESGTSRTLLGDREDKRRHRGTRELYRTDQDSDETTAMLLR